MHHKTVPEGTVPPAPTDAAARRAPQLAVLDAEHVLRPAQPLRPETRERVARVLAAVRIIEPTAEDISRYLTGAEAFPDHVERLMAHPAHSAELLDLADVMIAAVSA